MASMQFVILYTIKETLPVQIQINATTKPAQPNADPAFSLKNKGYFLASMVL